MSAIIGGLTWLITNWQIIATAFSSISSIALFFMHGTARQELAELRVFIDSIQVSQIPTDQQPKKV